MNCPDCDGRMKCLDTRPAGKENNVRRRYGCLKCGGVHNTLEILAERCGHGQLVTQVALEEEMKMRVAFKAKMRELIDSL